MTWHKSHPTRSNFVATTTTNWLLEKHIRINNAECFIFARIPISRSLAITWCHITPFFIWTSFILLQWMQRKRASHHFFGFWSLARALTAQRTSNYFRVIYGLVPSDSQGELEKLLTGFPQSSPGFISIENGSVVRATAKVLYQSASTFKFREVYVHKDELSIPPDFAWLERKEQICVNGLIEASHAKRQSHYNK